MSSYELRSVIDTKNQQINHLRGENDELRQKVDTLSDWNSRWQKLRWNQEMIRQCECLRSEFGKLSDVQTTIIKYLASLRDRRGTRHVRGLARELGISPSTVCVNLKRLQQMGLARAYLRNSNRKKFYTMPDALQFFQ